MALLGQASGGWTESSSALRLLHVGIRNTVGILTTDAFTQTNPPAVANTNASAGMDTATLGVLSGAVAFTRGDAAGGSNEIGGPTAVQNVQGIAPLGLFINTAVGNAYENTPGVASGKGPYVSGQGTYASSLYEDHTTDGGDTALVYQTGDALYASFNGYLTNAAADEYNVAGVNNVGFASLVLGALKMPADAVQPEIVFDQRI